jgi:glycosyltransferase involved in cell wall biosynthesis
MAAHGMADPWALRHKPWKKRLYTWAVEGKNLRHAACLHALSVPEVAHLRRLATRTPIALVPNGVHLAPFEDLPGRELLEARHPELRGKFLLLFLSRLHVKKGLDLLAEGVIALARDHPELHVLLAGRDEGAGAVFQDTLAAAGLGRAATSLGHVQGEAARLAWGAADAFVLPSYSEGFSMAVLEALAARRAVLISTACHFPELGEYDGGIVVEPTVAAVQEGMRALLAMTPQERAAMAGRGRALVERDYTWIRQGRRLAELYRWIVGGGSPPEFVELA